MRKAAATRSRRGKKAAAIPASSCDVDELPDQLLGAIFALAGRPEGRWHRVFFSEKAIWSSIELREPCNYGMAPKEMDPQRLHEQRRRLLQRVGGLVERLEAEGGPELEAYLQLLHPDSIKALCLSLKPLGWRGRGPAQQRAAAAAAVAAARRFPALSELQLCCEKVPTSAVGDLAQLPQLRSLSINTYAAISAAALARMAGMSGLTALALHTSAGWSSAAPLQHLTRLARLQRLQLSDWGDNTVRCPAPADFPALVRCHLVRSTVEAARFKVAGGQLHTSSFGWWHYEHDSGSNGAAIDIAAGSPGHSSSSSSSSSSNGGCSDGRDRLKVEGLLCEGPLAAALAALVPPAAPPLASLSLVEARLRVQQEPCPQLAGLTHLGLARCTASGGQGGMAALLAGLLPLVPRLRSLAVQTGLGGAVPPCVANLRGLTALDLSGNGLRDLPAGDYLTGLEDLALSGNRFWHLPRALAAATRLRRLRLASRHPMALPVTDADEVLLRMPHLTRLDLGEGIECGALQPEVALARLRAARPGLRVRCAGEGSSDGEGSGWGSSSEWDSDASGASDDSSDGDW